MTGDTMRCLSSSLLPSNCSDITATSKLAPHLQGKGWPTQRSSSENRSVRILKAILRYMQSMHQSIQREKQGSCYPPDVSITVCTQI